MSVSNENIDRESKSLLISFVNSIRVRDTETYHHSRRVATYAQRLSRYLGWSRTDARELALAALLHDLGKTWIGNDILLKEDVLSEEERRIMERHPLIGARILVGCEVHSFYVETVLYHHEMWDGRGYPSGLKGEEIPVSARIVTIVDYYDILTSQGMLNLYSKDAVREKLLLGSATNFDPTIIRAFLNLLDTNQSFELPRSINSQPNRPEYHLPLHHSPIPIGI
jgi:putative nucleotidyltransferase with HDIG domain